MTNKQRYQQTFSVLHASESSLLEVTKMKKATKRYIPRLAAVCAAVILVMGLATVAYAQDMGGIQRKIQLWIHGDQTDAILDIRGSEYSVTYQDGQGQSHEIGGGGVAINPDGSERPLTEAEILEHLDAPDVVYRKDGTVWVTYHGAWEEITDRFDEDGVCYVQINANDATLYLTVKYDNGYAYSPSGYIQPEEFN